MNNRDLLRDVLNEPAEPNQAGSTDFEAAVFRKTLGTARRVRRARIATRVGAVVLVGALAFFQLRTGKDSGKAIVATRPDAQPYQNDSSYTALRSQPFTGVIRTGEISAAPVLLSQAASVTLLRTGAAGGGEVNLLTDEELLSFFPGQAVALVRHGPHNAELLFLDRE